MQPAIDIYNVTKLTKILNNWESMINSGWAMIDTANILYEKFCKKNCQANRAKYISKKIK